MPVNLPYLQEILDELAQYNARLVAVSKTRTVDEIRELIAFGHLRFGENRVQELVQKQEELADHSEIEWHLVGHLQRNKIKSIIDFTHMIHSVDSFRLLNALNKEAEKAERKVNCLLQVHIAQESSKYGFASEELTDIDNPYVFHELKNINYCGLMGMATFTGDERQIESEFNGLRKLQEQLSAGHFAGNPNFKELSMGMSGDYKIALQCGSTIVRIGSAIFEGKR